MLSVGTAEGHQIPLIREVHDDDEHLLNTLEGEWFEILYHFRWEQYRRLSRGISGFVSGTRSVSRRWAFGSIEARLSDPAIRGWALEKRGVFSAGVEIDEPAKILRGASAVS